MKKISITFLLTLVFNLSLQAPVLANTVSIKAGVEKEMQYKVYSEDAQRDLEELLHPIKRTNYGSAVRPETASFFESNDNETLVKLAMAEAEGEGIIGKALVIRIVINRLESENFPDSIDKIVTSDQFSVMKNGRFKNAEPDKECWEALAMVLEGWDESDGALYFDVAGRDSWQARTKTLLFTEGNHTFYK